MKHIELVVFENHSIMNEKVLSLPIGKVSFRQLGVILSGILGAMLGYFITKDLIVPGVVLCVFLGLGMINTKIMSPDQLIKSYLIFLIRDTSLEKNRPQKVKSLRIKSEKTKTDNKEKTKSRDKPSLLSQIFSQLSLLFIKNHKLKYSVKIELTKDNQLKISPTKQSNLSLLQDKIKIESDDSDHSGIILKNNHMILPLDKSKDYDISTIIDPE